MKNKTVLLISLILVLLLSSCDAVAETIAADNADQLETTEAQQGDQVGETVVAPPGIEENWASLTLGDILTVQIPTIPTEGYEWVVKNLDTSILVQEGNPLYKQHVGVDAAGGVVIINFRAVGTGEVHLSLEYVGKVSSDQGQPSVSKGTFGMNVIVRNVGGEIVVVRPAIKGVSATLTVGDTLIVEIPTIPTEEYEWVVDKLDPAILVQEGKAEYTPDTSANAAGGIVSLSFKAIATGETNLSLFYTNAGTDAGSQSFSKNSFGMGVIVREAGGETVVVTPAIEGNAVTLNLGDRLVLQIPTIPTEGYDWVVEDIDSTILVQDGNPIFKANIGAESAGGIVILQFRAIGRGTTSLNLAYVGIASADQGAISISKGTFGMQVDVK